ncbi:hypothetical protein AB0K20_23215 [Micromonospora matsumotoense]|uniref:hypothetical protein n=1 Tax=Micromonospora matsumotoense TaxID=121616 RepID=UPI00343C16A2
MSDVDDWLDDEPHWGAYEEPPWGAQEEPHCEACNPTRFQRAWWLLTWRVHRAVRWLGDRLTGRRYDDEAPF